MSVAAGVRTVIAAVVEQYRTALSLFVAAPGAVLLVMVPEFAQHVAEIRIGMFESLEAARSLSANELRFTFGIAKLIGLAFAFFACARAAWIRIGGGEGRWYRLGGIAWGRMILGVLLFIGVGFLAEPLNGLLPWQAMLFAQLLATVASLPFLFIALSGLFGDAAPVFGTLIRRCWPGIGLLLVLMLTGFGVLQLVHMLNHRVALGAPAAAVWALMIWDTLVVGGIAATTGAAWAIGYRRAVA